MEMDCDDANWIGPAIIMLILDFDTSCVELTDCVCRRAWERNNIASDRPNRWVTKIPSVSQVTLQWHRWWSLNRRRHSVASPRYSYSITVETGAMLRNVSKHCCRERLQTDCWGVDRIRELKKALFEDVALLWCYAA